MTFKVNPIFKANRDARTFHLARRFGRILFAIFVAAGLALVEARADYSKTDEELKEAVVKGFIVNPDVFAANAQVKVEKGVVTLTGSVKNNEARAAAEAVAKSVPGVKQVRNLLKIIPAR